MRRRDLFRDVHRPYQMLGAFSNGQPNARLRRRSPLCHAWEHTTLMPMRCRNGIRGLRRVQGRLAAILLAFFLLQLPLTGLLAGRHVSEMAFAALLGDSICQPGQAGDTPDQPKAPPGHNDCCLAGCLNPSGTAAALPVAGLAALPDPRAAAALPSWRELIAPPARFASGISARGPPAKAA